MRKYDFIRFGQCVQWEDDITGICRTMQVCCPLPNPITDNVKIQLIPSDSDNYAEEESISYSASACELFPLSTPYNDRYWCALQTAMTVGADRTVLSEMLRKSNLTFEECLLYMQYSNSYSGKWYAIVDSVFPEESKYYSHIETITWNEKKYATKKLTIFKDTIDEKEVIISVIELEHKLIDRRNDIPISNEAKKMDADIYFYLREKEINLPDDEIIAIVESA